MSLGSFINSLFSSKSKNMSPNTEITSIGADKKLTYSEKERIAVQRTSLQDVQSLEGFPFDWNTRLQKSLAPQGHPFAFMDITGKNVSVALSEIARVNDFIQQSKSLCRKVPQSLSIPINKIVMTPSPIYGYTRIICSPVSYLGEPTEIPVKLLFMTDLSKDDSTHGEICYGREGIIQTATIYFCRRNYNYSFYLKNVSGELELHKIERLDAFANKEVIYKGPHLLAYETRLVQEESDFAWLLQYLPDKCPKSITGYRRMKTQNTKNYQILKALAAEQGREI